jgi:hypothetical protein
MVLKKDSTEEKWGKGGNGGGAIRGVIELRYAGAIAMSRLYHGKKERREFWAMMNRYAKHRVGAFITIIPE